MQPPSEPPVSRRIMTCYGYRIYFGRDGTSLVLLLAGGTKVS